MAALFASNKVHLLLEKFAFSSLRAALLAPALSRSFSTNDHISKHLEKFTFVPLRPASAAPAIGRCALSPLLQASAVSDVPVIRHSFNTSGAQPLNLLERFALSPFRPALASPAFSCSFNTSAHRSKLLEKFTFSSQPGIGWSGNQSLRVLSSSSSSISCPRDRSFFQHQCSARG